MKEIISFNWTQINEFIIDIYKQLNENDFIPDLIIGVARGGVIPAVNLSYLFNCRNFGIIQFQRTIDDKPFSLVDRNNKYIGKYLPKGNFKKILLVDDIIVEGVIFKDAVDKINNTYSNSFELCSAFIFNQYSGKPLEKMFYSQKINKNKWVEYPWENSSVERK